MWTHVAVEVTLYGACLKENCCWSSQCCRAWSRFNANLFPVWARLHYPFSLQSSCCLRWILLEAFCIWCHFFPVIKATNATVRCHWRSLTFIAKCVVTVYSNSLSKQVYLANNSMTDSRNCTEHMHCRPIIKNSTQTLVQNHKGDPEFSTTRYRIMITYNKVLKKVSTVS